MMGGTKRFAGSDSNSLFNDSIFQTKRVMGGSPFDSNKAEPSQQQQQAMTAPLDMQQAESSRQHVRALNAQFASWVQLQLQNHPDELWEDGVQDYLNHASNIMEKFSDVVNWLKANATKGDTGPELTSAQNNLTSGNKDNSKPGSAITSSTGIFGSSWGSVGQSNVLNNSKEIDNKSSSGKQGNFLFPTSASEDTNKSRIAMPSTTGIFGSSWSSGAPQNPQSESKQIGNNNLASEKTGNAPAFTTATFGSSWSSGISANNNPPFSFGIQSSLGGSQSVVPPTNNASNEEDGEDSVEQPSSPSVKKTEEKGITVVHEVKCKLYVKSSDPGEAWKDKGMGQLSIKCKEGFSKGTKESKPTIIVRNDVGKLVLNALLYPGIKTTLQKNCVVAIFHSSGDGDDSNSVVARTFLLKTKTAEDRDKLAAVIQEYAPTT